MGGAYTKPYDIEIVQHAIECDDVTIFKGQLHKYISKTNNMYHESNKIRPEEIFVEEYIIQHESMEIFKYMIQKKLMRFHNVCTSNFILGHLNRKKIIKYVLQLCKKNNVVLDKPVSHKKNILYEFINSCHTTNVLINNEIYNIILTNYSQFIDKYILHHLLNVKFPSLPYVLLEDSFMFLTFYNLLSNTYENYNTTVDENGDTLLMAVIRIVMKMPNISISSCKNIITKMLSDEFDINFVNACTQETIINIIKSCQSHNHIVYILSLIPQTRNVFSDLDIFKSAIVFNQVRINEILPHGKYEKIFTENKNSQIIIDVNTDDIYTKKYHNPFPNSSYTGSILHTILKYIVCIEYHTLTYRNYKYLLANFSDYSLTDSHDSTLLDIAVQCDHPHIIPFIPNFCCVTNRIGTYGEYCRNYKNFNTDNKIRVTPLVYAYEYGGISVMNELLNISGINLCFQNSDGTTVMQTILSSNKTNKVKLKLIFDKIGNNKTLINHYKSNTVSTPPDTGTSIYCKICMENKIDIVFYPCSHAICCNKCYKVMKSKHSKYTEPIKCGICKSAINYPVSFMI